jgi:single-stranded DNA-binding protein
MSDLNLFAFSGRLMADPVLSKGENTDVCHFTLVSNQYSVGEERPAFLPITVFGDTARLCQEHLLKGHGAIVRGNVETSIYTTKEGDKRKSIDFIAREVNFNGRAKSQEPYSNDTKPLPERKAVVDKKDVSQEDVDNFRKSYRPNKKYTR